MNIRNFTWPLTTCLGAIAVAIGVSPCMILAVPPCAPGSTRTCACPGPTSGTTTCRSDHTFGACGCMLDGGPNVDALPSSDVLDVYREGAHETSPPEWDAADTRDGLPPDSNTSDASSDAATDSMMDSGRGDSPDSGESRDATSVQSWERNRRRRFEITFGEPSESRMRSLEGSRKAPPPVEVPTTTATRNAARFYD